MPAPNAGQTIHTENGNPIKVSPEARIRIEKTPQNCVEGYSTIFFLAFGSILTLVGLIFSIPIESGNAQQVVQTSGDPHQR